MTKPDGAGRRASDNGGGLFGGMGQPGQRELIRPSAESEVWRPVKQWLVASGVALVVYGLLIAVVSIIGSGVAYVLGLVAIVVVGVAVATRLGENMDALAALFLVVAASMVLWLFFGWELSARAWPHLLGWKVLVPLGLLIPVNIAAFVIARYIAEIRNPNYPPPFAAVSPYARLNPTGQRFLDPDLPEPEQVIEPPRVRHVPVYTNRPELVLSEAKEPQIVDAQADPTLAVLPDASEVRRADLFRYLERAPIIGTSFDRWHEAHGWQYGYWRAVVSELARFGITNEPQARVATRLLVEPREAAERLRDG